MEIENALGLLKEVCEQHGAKCYLDAFDTISTSLSEALKHSHNTGSQKCLCEVYNVWNVMGDIAINKDCPFHGQALLADA